MLSGADVDALSSLSVSTASSSLAIESRLLDRSGTSAEYRPPELRCDIEIAGVVAFASLGSQQKVSLFHNLQLKFSSRRPSSIDPAHLLKTVHMLKRFSTCIKESLLGYMLHSRKLITLLTFFVSMRCIEFASTVSTGVSKVEGMTLNVTVCSNVELRKREVAVGEVYAVALQERMMCVLIGPRNCCDNQLAKQFECLGGVVVMR